MDLGMFSYFVRFLFLKHVLTYVEVFGEVDR